MSREGEQCWPISSGIYMCPSKHYSAAELLCFIVEMNRGFLTAMPRYGIQSIVWPLPLSAVVLCGSLFDVYLTKCTCNAAIVSLR